MFRSMRRVLFPVLLVLGGCEEKDDSDTDSPSGRDNGGDEQALLSDEDRQEYGRGMLYRAVVSPLERNLYELLRGRISNRSPDCEEGSTSASFDGNEETPPIQPFSLDVSFSDCVVQSAPGRPLTNGTWTVTATATAPTSTSAEAGTLSGTLSVEEVGVTARSGTYDTGSCSVSGSWTYNDDDGVITDASLVCGEYTYRWNSAE